MNRVFISYSRRNKDFAERFAHDLSDAGLDVWIDFRQIIGGEFWRDEIQRGLENSDYLIAVLSKDALASTWVAKEINTMRELGKPIIPIFIHDVLDSLQTSEKLSWLLDVQFIDFVIEPYEDAFRKLLSALPNARTLGAFDQPDPSRIINPFKGLEAFQQTDAGFFFGREELVQKSLDRLKKSRFLAIVGASGSGKSSLVRAGVIPQLRSGALPDSERSPIILLKPEEHPILSLATRLHPLIPTQNGTEQSIEQIVNMLLEPSEIRSLIDSILTDAPESACLYIVVDQFEEVFTRAGEKERDTFITFLENLILNTTLRVKVIITLRADFMSNISQHQIFAEMFEQDSMVLVTPMTSANLIRAIEGPAEAVGLQYERGLVDAILSDVENQPGSLPLLQYALRELFLRRQGRMLTNQAYDEIGGVQQALAQQAEKIYQELPENEQELMRQILLKFVEVNDNGEVTRRTVARDSLQFRNASPEDVDRILERLTAPDARLLVASREIRTEQIESAPKVWLDVGHEALIREWARFRTWVSTNLEDLQYASELRKAAQDWITGDRDNAYLLTGKRLTQAEVWLERADVTALQRQFIQASLAHRANLEQREKERQENRLRLEQTAANRLRWAVGVLVLGLLVAGVLALIAMENGNRAEERSRELEEQSIVLERTANEARSLATSANAAQAFGDARGDLALALAVEANQIENPPPQSHRILSQITLAAGSRFLYENGSDDITAMAYDDNTHEIISGLRTGEISVLDARNQQELFRFVAHPRAVNDLAISPDQRYLLSGSRGNSENLRLWDAKTGILVAELVGHTSHVNTLVITPDGQTGISGGADSQLIFWELPSGTADTVIDVGEAITELAISQDGESLAVGTNSGEITVLDLTADNAPVWSTSDEPESSSTGTPVSALAFDPANPLLLSADTNGDLVIRSAETGNEALAISSLGSAINSAVFIPESNLFALGMADGTLQVWDMETGQLQDIFDIDEAINELAISADGKNLVSETVQSLRMWDIQGSEEIHLNIASGTIVDLDINSNQTEMIYSTRNGDIITQSVRTGDILDQFNVFTDEESLYLTSGDYHEDTGLIVVARSDQSIQLWTLQGELLQTFTGHEGLVNRVSFNGDASQIASGSGDDTVRIWSPESSEAILTLEGHTGQITDLQYSRDSTRLITSALDGTMILWDASTGEMIQRFQLPINNTVIWSVATDPSNTWVLSGSSDQLIRLWDIESGQEVRRFEGHDNNVRHVAFPAAIGRIISAASDGTIRLWDMNSGVELHRYNVQGNRVSGLIVRALTLGQDGDALVTALGDRTIRQWQLLPERDDLLSWTSENRFVPELDCNTRLAFGLINSNEAGEQLILNASQDSPINIFASPNSSSLVVASMEEQTAVRILQYNDSNDWIQICGFDDTEGWITPDASEG